MNSSKTLTVGLFLLWTIIAHCGTEGFDLNNNVLDFFHTFNGIFDNFDQDKEEGGKHVNVEVRARPVYLHKIQEEPMLYFEESINGVIYRMWVCTVAELPNSHVIEVLFYNFTDISQYKPRTFNTDELANLTSKDMHNNDGCAAYYEQISPGVFSGYAIDCRHSVSEQHLLYSVIFTCYGLWFQPPVFAAEKTTTPLRYHLRSKNHRYKVTGIPYDYHSPCEKCV